MPAFKYSAVNGQGGGSTGVVEAGDQRQAVTLLRAQGLFPVRLDAADGGKVADSRAAVAPQRSVFSLALFGSVKERERAAFTRQLGTLLRAGMPLLRGLEVLARQEKNPALRRVIGALAEGIKSGVPLSEAMAPHDRIFDRLYVSMIRAGEAGGVLDTVLERLAHFQEKSLQLRGKVKAAMIYPLIVLGVAVAILVGLLVFVVPKFQQIFADLLKGAPLPPLTLAVLTVSDTVRNHAPVVLAVVAVVAVGFHFFRRSDPGARFCFRRQHGDCIQRRT